MQKGRSYARLRNIRNKHYYYQDLDNHDDTLTANYQLQQGAVTTAATSTTRVLNVPKQRV